MKKKDLNEGIVIFFFFLDVIYAYPRFDPVNSFLS